MTFAQNDFQVFDGRDSVRRTIAFERKAR